ncbi:Acyltransferase family [Vibrio sp. B1REV9]|uniref:acyltransferase family protein n=1 Tax=Vibrio sp. B1REV9 TaxID=2751179 RepID=UPI001AF3473C|nr:acyltransferase [Vibrio sp. B1REV9]CAE6928207.1 Acyltransferase family [Vibrio sp. B1REV9]
MYLTSFSYFRAIAIIFIVAGHLYKAAGIQFDHFANILVQNLIAGGTSLFVFISGFLFFHVFCQHFNFKEFYKKKLKYVLIPYLILGFLPLLYHVLSFKEDWNGFFYPQGDGIIQMYLIPALKYYATGRFMAAYWYIPFAITLFMMSPLHRRFAYIKASHQMLIILSLSVIAIFIHRPVDNLSMIQSLFYYTPVYLLGIFCSVHYERCIHLLKGYEVPLLLVVISLAITQTVYGHIGNYHKEAFNFAGIDLVYVQKIALCLFFMIYLKRYDHKTNKVIELIASTSFSIYFLHIYFAWSIGILNNKVNLGVDNGSWITYLTLLVSITGICIAIACLTKKLIPKYSRYIIGY